MTIDSKKYKILSAGANNTCILYGKLVAKVFDFGEPAVRREADLLNQANQVNNLLVKSFGIQISEDYQYELLTMERLYGLQYRFIDVEERVELFNALVKQVKELHKAGLTHWDIKRPSHVCDTPERYWDNIILTPQGLRLIDMGNAVTSEDPDFDDAVLDDLQSLERFKQVFLIP